VLTSFAGSPPETTILERGIYTFSGGILALLAYIAWPTWERTQTPRLLATLFDAYRQYFTTVMTCYRDPRQFDPAMATAARQACRLARSNAEASIDRLRGESERAPTEIERYESLLAALHRFARSVMVLEAGERDNKAALQLRALPRFIDDVDHTMQAISRTLRQTTPIPEDLPDLQGTQRILDEEADARIQASPSNYRLAELVAETDRIAESMSSIVVLVQT
jgi:uncharacterized membrane protein YccC